MGDESNSRRNGLTAGRWGQMLLDLYRRFTLIKLVTSNSYTQPKVDLFSILIVEVSMDPDNISSFSFISRWRITVTAILL